MNETAPKRAPALRDDALRREAFARISAAVGERGWTSDPAEMAPRLRDERGMWRGEFVMPWDWRKK